MRTNTLKVRLSDAELARLDRLAADYGLKTRAGMLRALLMGAESPEVTAAGGLVPGPSLESLLEDLRRDGFDQRWALEDL
jgi:hypothetical protein